MATYLLAWNPKHYNWDDISDMSRRTKRGESVEDGWSCGNCKRIQAGDRVFLIRLGVEPRGIVASGKVTRGSYAGKHWNREKQAAGKSALYVKILFDTVLDPEAEGILPRAALDSPRFSAMHWDTQMSGIRIPDEVAAELEETWVDFTAGTSSALPEEVDDRPGIPEGAKRTISVNAYERSAVARAQCIAHFGASCAVCGFNFGRVYGDCVERLFHVHHLVPLSEVGDDYEVDPVHDLIPVCPNCHAVIHSRTPPLTVADVKRLLQSDKV